MELNRNRPQDDSTATIEHIIPWALGGSHGFTINDVSKKLNNDLGSQVDAPFANTVPLALMRHSLGLKGRGGSSQPIVWQCESDTGIKGELRIQFTGKIEINLRPVVKELTEGDAERLVVGGTRETVTPMLEGLLQGLQKRSQQAYSQNGKLISSLEDFLAVSQKVIVDNLD